MYWISTYVSSLEVSETTAWKMIGSSRKNRAPAVVPIRDCMLAQRRMLLQ